MDLARVLHMKHTLTSHIGFGLATLTMINGCAASSGSSDTSEDALIAESGREFSRELSAMRARLSDCVQSEQCEDDGTLTPVVSTRQTLAIQSSDAALLNGESLCDALTPESELTQAVLLYGANVGVNYPFRAEVGIEFAWDLRHRQVAVYVNKTAGIASTFGVSAGAYLGMAAGSFDKDPGDIQGVWGRQTVLTAEAVVTLPFDIASAGIRGFATQDTNTNTARLYGAALYGAIGLKIKLPIPAEVSILASEHGPSNRLTEWLGASTYGVRHHVEANPKFPDQKYIQFNSTPDMVLALSQTGGLALAVPIAAATLASDILKRHGLTPSHACPGR
jgi:hypothetical protein